MSKTIPFTCVSDIQTHSDKKRAQFILADSEELKIIHSIQIAYNSTPGDKQLFTPKDEYEFVIPHDESAKMEVEPEEEKTEE